MIESEESKRRAQGQRPPPTGQQFMQMKRDLQQLVVAFLRSEENQSTFRRGARTFMQPSRTATTLRQFREKVREEKDNHPLPARRVTHFSDQTLRFLQQGEHLVNSIFENQGEGLFATFLRQIGADPVLGRTQRSRTSSYPIHAVPVSGDVLESYVQTMIDGFFEGIFENKMSRLEDQAFQEVIKDVGLVPFLRDVQRMFPQQVAVIDQVQADVGAPSLTAAVKALPQYKKNSSVYDFLLSHRSLTPQQIVREMKVTGDENRGINPRQLEAVLQSKEKYPEVSMRALFYVQEEDRVMQRQGNQSAVLLRGETLPVWRQLQEAAFRGVTDVEAYPFIWKALYNIARFSPDLLRVFLILITVGVDAAYSQLVARMLFRKSSKIMNKQIQAIIRGIGHTQTNKFVEAVSSLLPQRPQYGQSIRNLVRVLGLKDPSAALQKFKDYGQGWSRNRIAFQVKMMLQNLRSRHQQGKEYNWLHLNDWLLQILGKQIPDRTVVQLENFKTLQESFQLGVSDVRDAPVPGFSNFNWAVQRDRTRVPLKLVIRGDNRMELPIGLGVQEQAWGVVNVALLLRELCWRIWKARSTALYINGEIPPQYANITLRGDLLAKRGSGWGKPYYVTGSGIWHVVSPYLQPQKFFSSVAALATDLYNQIKKHLQFLDDIGEEYQSPENVYVVTSLSVRSDYFQQIRRLVRHYDNGIIDSFDTFASRASFISSQASVISAIRGQQWRVGAGQRPQDPQYTIFLAQVKTNPHYTALYLQNKVAASCLGYLCTFFVGTDKASEQPFFSWIRQGRIYSIYERLNKMGHNIGLVRLGYPVLSQFKEFRKHISVTAQHVTLISWQQAQKIQNSSVFSKKGRALMGDKVYEKRTEEEVPENPDPTASLLLANPIPQFTAYCGRTNVSISNAFRCNVLFWDIQCFAFSQIPQFPYLSCLLGWERFEWTQFYCWAKNPTEDVMRSVVQAFWNIHVRAQKRGDKVKIWTFNGFKYQLKFLMKPLLQRFPAVRSLGALSQTKGIIISDHLTLLDARTLYTTEGLLQNSQKANVYFKKKAQIGIDKIISFEQWQNRAQQIGEYNRLDCLATAELVQRFYLTAYITGMQIQRAKSYRVSLLPVPALLNCHTCPQLAMAYLNWYFVGKNLLADNQPRFMKKIHRDNYYGGMTQVFQHIPHQSAGKIYYLDVNSMYPYIMTFPLPFFYKGQRIIHRGSHCQLSAIRNGQRDLTYYHCVSIKQYSRYTSIPVRSKHGLLYPRVVQDVWVWGNVLKGLTGQFDIDRAVDYSDVGPNGQQFTAVKEYILYFYQKKKHEKEHLRKTMVKLFVNSTYGKWAQRWFADHFYLTPQLLEQIQKDCWEEKSKDHLTHSDCNVGVGHAVFQGMASSIIGDFVRLASYVTYGARSHLIRAAEVCGPSSVFYCDTDSVFVSASGYEALRSAGYCDQGELQVLGKFKLEKVVVDGVKVPAIFDEGIFISRKNYMLKMNEPKTFLWKAKGFNWKGNLEKKEQVYNLLKQRLTSRIQEQILNLYPMPKVSLGVQLKCSRWIWNSTKSAVIIQKYWKQINMNGKRRCIGRGLTLPFEQKDMIKFV